MRLLNTEKMEMENFFGAVPRYAILSHTWTKEEITFQEFLAKDSTTQSKKGYAKVQKCAALCREKDFRHVWIDTISIDKTSSAELSEAINSMWKWYRDAEVCFVYLEDVACNFGEYWTDNSWRNLWWEDARFQGQVEEIKKSRWFTRGWTLQELIAPRNMLFLSSKWHTLGTKGKLLTFLSLVTHIDAKVLYTGDVSSASVAQRISWAAHRQTTRIEDIAYCLLGIFDINMPLLYGESAKAFQRLQEEIIKTSSDLTIFAWEDVRKVGPRQHIYRGLLASSPLEFQDSGNLYFERGAGPSNPYSITNRGVSIRLALKVVDKRDELYVADLGTFRDRDVWKRRGSVRIYLKRLSKNGDQFARICTGVLPRINRPGIDSAISRAVVHRFGTGPYGEHIFVPQHTLPILPERHPTFAVSKYLIKAASSNITCEFMTPGAFHFDGDHTLHFSRPLEKLTGEPVEIPVAAVMAISTGDVWTDYLILLGCNRKHGAWWEARSRTDLEELKRLVLDVKAMARKKSRGVLELGNAGAIYLSSEVSLEGDQLAITVWVRSSSRDPIRPTFHFSRCKD